MKVAVIITGLPRNVQEGYDKCWGTYIKEYSADVYLQHWDTYESDVVSKIYPTAQILKSYNINFEKYTNGINVKNKDFYNSFPLFYGWNSIVPFIGEDYDVIIRGRYDITTPFVDLNSIDLSYFNVCNNWKGAPFPDDNFSISGCGVYKLIFENIFSKLVKFSKTNNELYFPERNLYEIMKMEQLDNLILKSIPSMEILRESNHSYKNYE